MILEDSGLPYMYIKFLMVYFSREKVHICQQFLSVGNWLVGLEAWRKLKNLCPRSFKWSYFGFIRMAVIT